MRALMIRHALNACASVMGNGSGIVGTMAEKAGHYVRIIDNNTLYTYWSNRRFLKTIRKDKPDVVMFSIALANALETYTLFEAIRKQFPELIIIAGGIHMKHGWDEALDHGAHVVINREGELIMAPLLAHLEGRDTSNYHEGLEAIDGVSFRGPDGSQHEATAFPMVEKLDDLPPINYDLFNLNDYTKNGKEPGIAYFIGQRGCPFKCTFCSDDEQRADRRVASAKWMFDNVRILHEKYGLQYIPLSDNNFTFLRERAYEFCRLVIESGLNEKVSFSCQTKVETAVDNRVTQFSRLVFAISQKLEHMIFTRVWSLRYYLGTALFGRKVVT